MANENPTGTEKLLTLANLAKYNQTVCDKLGLGKDNFGYKAPTNQGNAASVKAALDELYSKAAGITGGTSSDKGVGVSIDAHGTPTVSVTGGTIAEGNGSVVLGGDVYTAIEEAKAADKYVTVDGQSITSEGGLISGTLTITSNNEGGSASLSVNPTLTESTADATAIATKEYVDEKAVAEKTVYSFGADTNFEKSGNTETYTVTIPLMMSVGGAEAKQSDEIVLAFDATAFVKDGFLKSVAYKKDAEGKDTEILVFTWNTDSGKDETTTEINLAKYIDIYTAGDKSIDITDHAIKVNLDGGYLELKTNGIGVDTSKLEGYSDTEATTGDNNIATKKYVDDTAKNSSVTATTTGNIEAFGDSKSITIKTGANDTEGTTFTVSLPSFTGNTGDDKVKVSIANDGTISVDEEVLDSAIEAASNNFTGKTTLGLSGEGATGDLADGDIVIALGGDGAAADQTVTIKDTRAAKDDQALSTKTDFDGFGSTAEISLSGVKTNATTATVTLPALTATASTAGANVQVTLVEGQLGVTTQEQGATGTMYTNTKLAQAAYVDEKIASISVVDGANITEDVESPTVANGIYVTVTGNTFTVGAVVATDEEIEGIFGTTAS